MIGRRIRRRPVGQSLREQRGRHQEYRNPLTGFVTIGLKPGRERGLVPKGKR